MGKLLLFACVVTLIAGGILIALRGIEIAVAKLLDAIRRRRDAWVRK